MAHPTHDAAQAHGTAAHVHGTMDIRDQERTFHGFLRLASWTAIVVICVLIFLGLVSL